MPGDIGRFMAPEGLRIVATGEAASGATDDAKPVVEVPFLILSLRRSEGFSNAGHVPPTSAFVVFARSTVHIGSCVYPPRHSSAPAGQI